VERRERKLHIRLDPDGPDHAKVLPGVGRVLEQRSLADPRFTVHDQEPAITAARGLQEAVEHLALAFAAEQLRSWEPNR
jgi:hypothetical protein